MLKQMDRKKQGASDTVLPILLVFLPKDAQQHLLVSDVAEQLAAKLKGKVQVLKIEEVVHPGVARSFAIDHSPAFVLVSQGTELWRQEGLPPDNLLELISPYLG